METRATGNVFARSWQLLFRNPEIAVPGFVAALLAGIVQYALEPSAESVSGNITSRLLQGLVQILVSILQIAYTTGMADAAWQRGVATFGDGARAFRRDGGHVFVAMLALFALGVVAAMLASYTLWLSLVAYVFFCIYTMASAVVGERTGLRAVAESAEIAYRRWWPTLVIVLGIVAFTAVMAMIAGLLAATPLLGPFLAEIVTQAFIAYIVLVLVGEYRLLRVAPSASSATGD